MSGTMTLYFCVYAIALLAALGITPLAAQFAHATHILDYPGTRKIHTRPIPLVGGVVVVMTLVVAVTAAALLDATLREAFTKAGSVAFATVLLGALMAAVGLMDDARGLRPLVKLGAQVVAALAACSVGILIDRIAVPGLFTIELGWVAWPVTVLWIVGLVNAVNLIDGLDGLAAGLATIACAVVAAGALWAGQPVLAVLALGLGGALTGFLFFNFNPARVFLGESGAMCVGFLIAVISILYASESANFAGLALPGVALAIPIFDTCFSVLRRVLRRRSVFSADRGHIHHRLLDMGLSQRRAVLFLYTLTILATGLASLMLVVDAWLALPILVCALVLQVLPFRAAGAIRLREGLAVMRANLAATRKAQDLKFRFDAAQQRLNEATTFEAWWKGLCAGAEAMGVSRLAVTRTGQDGKTVTVVWEGAGPTLPPEASMHLIVPFRDSPPDSPERAEIDVRINGSLETAALRAGLFARLVGGCSRAGLSRTRPAAATPEGAPARIVPETPAAPLPDLRERPIAG